MHKRSLLLSALLLSTSLMGQNDTSNDATEIPLEELLQTEYIPASHIANQMSNAASAVSIVTAQDIRDYGYRTLGEILGSMRGLQVFQDYSYNYLGGRGFTTPGVFAGRVIVMIDGYRSDDSYYGQALLGNDAILDVSVIDRVEYIPGGSSSGYSNGALLGAINIITKKGSNVDGAQVAVGYGNHDSRSRRAMFGKTFENGAEILVSASDYTSDGRNYTYNISGVETPENAHNSESNRRLFFKGSYKNISWLAGYSKRDGDVPSYPSWGEIVDYSLVNNDENRFARLKVDTDLTDDLKLSASVWYGEYVYGYSYPSGSDIDYMYHGDQNVKWYGSDVKLVGSWFENHLLSGGVEYRHDYDFSWVDVLQNWTTGEVAETYYGSATTRKTYSLYLYDDVTLSPSLHLNYGGRYEKSNNGYHAISPQAALIWNPRESTSLKFSTGQTNRQATPYEGDRVEPEKAWLSEIVAEERLDSQTKLIASLYRYRITDRIYNYPDITTHGAEIELEKHWENGTRLHTSYAYQHAITSEEGHLTPINSPRHIAKFNLSLPLVEELLRAGLEVQYLGSRPLYTNARQEYAPGRVLSNLNLLSHHLIPNCDMSLKVRNVTNKKYEDVIVAQYNGDLTYPQEGRTFWLQLEYNFQ
ncbi:TonB-dependent receptor plug domain-containing protein [Sulfuricurvum sp.]|uniref:TonB-dependent receptor plug domain-containing protein n=1 Tax=Sulfuricurvum sp. TaxID=2025608 RepID=UPI002E31E1F7|nr:TonB-dependent receptor [Sulfuricurvum sp.]HEX5330908.1 TonB-dependent receptor [Sulfuricurvum sp.]